MSVRIELDPGGTDYYGVTLWLWIVERDGREVARSTRPQLAGVALAQGRTALARMEASS